MSYIFCYSTITRPVEIGKGFFCGTGIAIAEKVLPRSVPIVNANFEVAI